MDLDRESCFWDLHEGDQTNPEIQYLIGRCYLEGDGVDQYVQTAEQWFRHAAAGR